MYAKYTMTFYDTLEWIGGWDNVNARNQIFNNLYTANQAICTVLSVPLSRDWVRDRGTVRA